MPAPSSVMVSAGRAGSVTIAILEAPESSALATISVRIVSSVPLENASRRSSSRWRRSTRVSPIGLRRADQIAAVVVAGEDPPLAERAPGLQDRAVLHIGELAQQLVERPRALGEQGLHAFGEAHR